MISLLPPIIPSTLCSYSSTTTYSFPPPSLSLSLTRAFMLSQMNVLGVHRHQITKPRKNTNKRCKTDIKVVYISSPMKVKTCVSKFRDLVQELTGKDSDADAYASRLATNVDQVYDNSYNDRMIGERELIQNSSVSSDESSLLTVDSFKESSSMFPSCGMEPFDDPFMTQKEASFFGMFTSNYFPQESFQLDPLKGFGSL